MRQEKQVLYLVDDDVDFLEITAGVLEAEGYRVERFTDPEDALRRMGEQVPDLLISDLMMDRYDAGFSFASKVKAGSFGDVPVIIVTAVSRHLGFDLSPRGPEDLAAMGADGWVDKPIDKVRLLGAVRRLLDRPKGGA